MNQTLSETLVILNAKEYDVIRRRFGIDVPRETLDAVGKSFHRTRERIRQIQDSAIQKIYRNLAVLPIKPVVKAVEKVLEKHGGVLPETDLVLLTAVHMEDPDLDAATVRLALGVNPNTKKVNSHYIFTRSWRLLRHTETQICSVARKAVKFLEERGTVQDVRHIAVYCRKQLSHQPTAAFVEAVLRIHTGTVQTTDGWGLKTWRSINPRSLEDKAEKVLTIAGKPMHFRLIHENVQNRFGGNPVIYSVHNALIRDARFTLVGRGVYALTDWGMEGGGIGDIIVRILKKAGVPLNRHEIARRVLVKRECQLATIGHVLQTDKRFKRVGRSVYTLV